MSKTNDNKQPVAVERKQPQAAPPPNEVFIRVGTTLYKVVDQPNISGGKVRKRIPWNMETLRQDYGKEFIKYVHKYDGFCTVRTCEPSHGDRWFPQSIRADKSQANARGLSEHQEVGKSHLW